MCTSLPPSLPSGLTAPTQALPLYWETYGPLSIPPWYALSLRWHRRPLLRNAAALVARFSGYIFRIIPRYSDNSLNSKTPPQQQENFPAEIHIISDNFARDLASICRICNLCEINGRADRGTRSKGSVRHVFFSQTWMDGSQVRGGCSHVSQSTSGSTSTQWQDFTSPCRARRTSFFGQVIRADGNQAQEGEKGDHNLGRVCHVCVPLFGRNCAPSWSLWIAPPFNSPNKQKLPRSKIEWLQSVTTAPKEDLDITVAKPCLNM